MPEPAISGWRAREPRRLARRYLREDAPFAAALLARSLHHRLTRRPAHRA